MNQQTRTSLFLFIATILLLFPLAGFSQTSNMTLQTGRWGASPTERSGDDVADFWNSGERLRFDCVFEEMLSPRKKRKSVLRGYFDLGENGAVLNPKIVAGTTALLLDNVHYSKFDVTHMTVKADAMASNYYAFINLALKPKIQTPLIKEILVNFDESESIFPPPVDPKAPHFVNKIEQNGTQVKLNGNSYCRVSRR